MTGTGGPRSSAPTEEDAARILTAVMGHPVASITRFPTGLAHYVYDAQLSDERRYVVRLTRLASQAEFAGAVYWHHELKPLGVPLPELFYADVEGTNHGFPTLIMERLPGTDLGALYPLLTPTQKRDIARQIAELQRRVATLPHGAGFGYALAYDDPALKSEWKDVMDASLKRSRGRIRAADVVDIATVERVQEVINRCIDYFDTVEPTCFLHDTTTKNVIVHEGTLSGVVDVDSVCFGDPLLTPALTRMALLGTGYDTTYVDAWQAELALTPAQQRVLTVYTAVFCLDFLAELGHAFNRARAQPVEPRRVQHLLTTLDELLAAAHDTA